VRKRVAAAPREALAAPNRPNERWSIDVTADTLADGRTFRTLNIVDDFSREWANGGPRCEGSSAARP